MHDIWVCRKGVGCAGTSGLASAIKMPSSSTVELNGRAPPRSQLRRVREKFPRGGRSRDAAVQRNLLSLALTLASARCVVRCNCVSQNRASSSPICLKVRLYRRTELGAI